MSQSRIHEASTAAYRLEELDSLSGREHIILHLWHAGKDVKGMLSRSTFSRVRAAILAKTGDDIAMVPTPSRSESMRASADQERLNAEQARAKKDLFTVRVADPRALENVSKVLFSDYEDDSLCVGPSVRLTGPVGCVQLDTREPANAFCHHALTVLKKRHGDAIELNVETGTGPTKISAKWTVEQSSRVRAMLGY